MNYQVGVEGKPAAKVARDFVRRVDEKLTNHSSQVFAREFLIKQKFISFQLKLLGWEIFSSLSLRSGLKCVTISFENEWKNMEIRYVNKASDWNYRKWKTLEWSRREHEFMRRLVLSGRRQEDSLILPSGVHWPELHMWLISSSSPVDKCLAQVYGRNHHRQWWLPLETPDLFELALIEESACS